MVEYLISRGFTKQEANSIIVNFKLKKTWNPIGVDYINIPIFNEFNEKEAYILDNYKRAVVDGNPIDRYSFRFLKKDKSILFNANKVFRSFLEGGTFPMRSIFLTEGVWDCLSLWSLGFNSVAITRAFMSFMQVRKVSRFTDNVIFALDNDPTGILAIEKAERMFKQCGVRTIRMKIKGVKDINEAFIKDRAKLLADLISVQELL